MSQQLWKGFPFHGQWKRRWSGEWLVGSKGAVIIYRWGVGGNDSYSNFAPSVIPPSKGVPICILWRAMVSSAGWRLPCRSGPPVDGPKDPWPRVLSLPERFVGDPASLALDNMHIGLVSGWGLGCLFPHWILRLWYRVGVIPGVILNPWGICDPTPYISLEEPPLQMRRPSHWSGHEP